MPSKIVIITYCFLLILLSPLLPAQQVQFASNIGPVIYKNCTPCHQQGAVAPFALENYTDVKYHAKMIRYVIEEGIMPPWKADRNYRHFHGERNLDSGFLALFTKWIDSGYPSGPGKTDFVAGPEKNELSKANYVIKMPNPLKLPASNTELFVSFIDSIEVPGERYLKGVTIVPGNKRVLHHVRVDFDTTDPGTKYNDENGFINTTNTDLLPLPALGMVANYVPGTSKYKYPDNMGLKVPKKIYVIVNLHYAPNSKEDYDSTKVYLYFYPEGYKPRQVTHVTARFQTAGYRTDDARIPKDSIRNIQISTYPTDSAISLISIQPHMHLLGKVMKIYAIAPGLDTIPLVRINNWDFNWQEIYYFNKPVVLPRGTIIYAEALYDNTMQNPRNPYYPPQDIYLNSGMKSTNEMMEFNIQLVKFQPGDKNLDLYK